MDFQVGDRVKNLLDDSPGLDYGEYGTIVRLRECATPVIEWDDFNPKRHNCDGEVKVGHGWFVYCNSQIELVHQCQDLGDICNTHMDISKFLFDEGVT